jgi:hypothetical protein
MVSSEIHVLVCAPQGVGRVSAWKNGLILRMCRDQRWFGLSYRRLLSTDKRGVI